MSNFFDLMDLNDDDDVQKEFKPIWAINQKDDEEILKWLTCEFNFLMKLNKTRH